jgi:hypothetical protein
MIRKTSRLLAGLCLLSLITVALAQASADQSPNTQVAIHNATYDANSRQLLLQIDSGYVRSDGATPTPVLTSLPVRELELVSKTVGCTETVSCRAELLPHDMDPQRLRLQMTNPSSTGQMEIPITFNIADLGELAATHTLAVERQSDGRQIVYFNRSLCPKRICRF